MRKQSFLRGAMVLTVAGFISKVLGAIYLVPLTRLIGAEGVGLYQMAYPVYGTMLVISVSGLPVAISKLVAERIAHGDPRGAARVFRIATVILIAVGAVLSYSLFAGARFLATRVLGDPRSYYSIRAISPAIVLVAAMSALRGYFQGLQTMTPTATSQIIEQVVRVITALLLAYMLLPGGVEFSAAGSAFGAVTGALAGLVLLLGIYFKERAPGALVGTARTIPGPGPGDDVPALSILREIMALALPVTIASLVVPLTDLTNAAIVPARLKVAGFDIPEATRLYGQFAVMAMSLVGLPTVITTAFATSLVPSISAAWATGNRRLVSERIQEAIRLTILIGVPSFVGLRILARQICGMLFACPEAGEPLAILSIGALFLCVQQTSSGILQGLGWTLVPVRSLLIGATVGASLNFMFTAVPGLGIRGAALGTALGFMTAGILNFAGVWIFDRARVGASAARAAFKSGLAALVMGAIVKVFYNKLVQATFSNSLATIAAIFAGALVYGAIIVLMGELTPRELRLIPVIGPGLARLAGTVHGGYIQRK
ncbi:MAG TPA: polysaccharide biosynthesis protein [Firmicutes bacterium]|nr:polysaccharide biosynthesis protein [Bacillota bacterium]